MAQMHLSKMDIIGTTGFAAVAENRCPNSPKGANALQLAMGTIISDHLHTVSCGRFLPRFHLFTLSSMSQRGDVIVCLPELCIVA